MSNLALVYGYVLSGPQKGRQLQWEDIETGIPDCDAVWLHFDYTQPQTRPWLENHSGLDALVIEALLSEETRPRAIPVHNGLLAALRGVNLSPGSNPEDMVSVRLWSDGRHIISTRRRRLLSTGDLAESIAAGQGPQTADEFIVELSDRLITRMADTIADIEDQVAQIEEQAIHSGSFPLRGEIAHLRRQIIAIRRYLGPQREAMMQLQSEKFTWIGNDNRIRLRETTDHLVRYIEDLDSVRDRAAVTQEELSNRLSEQMNKRMYVLSIAASVFLPLGFLTGLLGINVGGIPGADNPYAFLLFMLLLIALLVAQIWVFKRKNWF